MSQSKTASGPLTGGLLFAAGVSLLTAASLAALALAAVGGSWFGFSISGPGALALALLFVVAGIETIRRRHFWVAFLVPAIVALACLGYYATNAQPSSLWSVAIWGAAALLIWRGHGSFAD